MANGVKSVMLNRLSVIKILSLSFGEFLFSQYIYTYVHANIGACTAPSVPKCTLHPKEAMIKYSDHGIGDIIESA